MPPPRKRPRPKPRPRVDRNPQPQYQAPAETEVRPEIASIIARTRAATSKAELQQLCEEAIELKLNDPDTLRAFYQKKIDALSQ